MQVCGLNDVKCLAENSKYWRQLALPPQDLKVELDAAGLSCSCPSGCFELTYSVETSYADYPSAVAESKVTIYIKKFTVNFKLFWKFIF